MDQDFAIKFFALAEAAKSIIITAHTSPDDDSIGSMLSMYGLLIKKYPTKKIRMVYSGLRPNRYATFAYSKLIEFEKEVATELRDDDLLIMLDGADYGRFTKMPEKLAAFAGKTICIDHHRSPPSQFTLALIDPTACSVAQILYEQFFINSEISPEVVETLYMGLLADSGDFSYLVPGQGRVFDMAKRLFELGNFEVQEFKARYSTIGMSVFSVVKEYIKNTEFKALPGWPKYMFSYLTPEVVAREQWTEIDIKEGGLMYMGAFLRTIEGYPWGIVLTPKKDSSWGLSARSLPESVNVRLLMQGLADGGGHNRAAGGAFKPLPGETLTFESCVKKIEQWMQNHEPELI